MFTKFEYMEKIYITKCMRSSACFPFSLKRADIACLFFDKFVFEFSKQCLLNFVQAELAQISHPPIALILQVVLKAVVKRVRQIISSQST